MVSFKVVTLRSSHCKVLSEVEAAIVDDDDTGYNVPWSRKQFQAIVDGKYTDGVVAKADRTNRLLGYVIYERNAIVRIGVDPDFRLQGIGRALVNDCRLRQRQSKCRKSVIDVRDTNLGLHLFLKRLGYDCVSRMPKHFIDEDGKRSVDGYAFECKLQNKQRSPNTESVVERTERMLRMSSQLRIKRDRALHDLDCLAREFSAMFDYQHGTREARLLEAVIVDGCEFELQMEKVLSSKRDHQPQRGEK